MTDIVERCRKKSDRLAVLWDICDDAADEIERLREYVLLVAQQQDEIERLRKLLRQQWRLSHPLDDFDIWLGERK